MFRLKLETTEGPKDRTIPELDRDAHVSADIQFLGGRKLAGFPQLLGVTDQFPASGQFGPGPRNRSMGGCLPLAAQTDTIDPPPRHIPAIVIPLY